VQFSPFVCEEGLPAPDASRGLYSFGLNMTEVLILVEVVFPTSPTARWLSVIRPLTDELLLISAQKFVKISNNSLIITRWKGYFHMNCPTKTKQSNSPLLFYSIACFSILLVFVLYMIN
jgi:hypothetical protein